MRSPTPQRVLVVDDEPRVREVVAAYLERDGYRVMEAADAIEARKRLADPGLDLVILDLMFPGASGIDLLTELRSQSQIPVIVLTAKTEEVDRVLGLELGADDYVTKPFSPRELVARVRSVLRRAVPPPTNSRIVFGSMEVDLGARDVRIDGAQIDLTAREFDLLAFLVSHPRQVFSRNQLLKQVWDSSADWQDPATVTVHIRRIRAKIERDARNPCWITTVWGVGYRFTPPSEDS